MAWLEATLWGLLLAKLAHLLLLKSKLFYHERGQLRWASSVSDVYPASSLDPADHRLDLVGPFVRYSNVVTVQDRTGLGGRAIYDKWVRLRNRLNRSHKEGKKESRLS
jgi:hypothetical protein